MAVVSSCREMLVKSATSATLVVSCHHSVGHSGETAGDKPEEGGDDVKSSCPYDLGYTRATMDDTESQNREVKLIS